MNELQERILNRCIVSESGCWEWTGAKRNGYGCMKINGTLKDVHRVSYTVHRGNIPKDNMVCHHCDNPSCVNPDHLFTGTRSDNMKDAFDKGRVIIPDVAFYRKGHISTLRTLTEKQVKKIKKDIEKWYPEKKTLTEIALINKVPYQRIADMRRKKPQAYFN